MSIVLIINLRVIHDYDDVLCAYTTIFKHFAMVFQIFQLSQLVMGKMWNFF